MTNKSLPLVEIQCKDCAFKKETNHWSSDGWDRMCDWVCSKSDSPNKKIAGSVEWHDKIETPKWCPMKQNTQETKREMVFLVTLVKDIGPFDKSTNSERVFSSESMAFEAVSQVYVKSFQASLGKLKGQDLVNKLKPYEKMLIEASSFAELEKIEQAVIGLTWRMFFGISYSIKECYVDEGF